MHAVKTEEGLMQQPSGRTALLSHGNQGGAKSDVKCRHCGKLYHTDAECVVKHPHLKSALDKRLKQKREKREKKRAELKAKSSSTTTTPQQEESSKATFANLAIRGCAASSEMAFELDD